MKKATVVLTLKFADHLKLWKVRVGVSLFSEEGPQFSKGRTPVPRQPTREGTTDRLTFPRWNILSKTMEQRARWQSPQTRARARWHLNLEAGRRIVSETTGFKWVPVRMGALSVE